MSILLQVERLMAGAVDSNANVILDSTVVSSGNVVYDSATGVITIQEAGSYEFDWWVATQSSVSTIGAGFALVSSQGDVIIGNSPIKTGEVVGIGVIEVATAPITVALRNISGAAIYYSTIVPVKASLAVIGMDEAGMVGPTGPTGPQGDIGPTGPQGPMAAFFPFSIANQSSAQIATNETGDPQIVQFCGFSPSAYTPIYLKSGDWAAGTITLSEAETPSYYGCSFVMPNDGTVKKLYVTFGSKMGINIEEGVTMYPFVCLAVANPTSAVNEIVYTILPETLTYTEPYVGEGTVPKFSIREGASVNLDTPIAEGALVAIVVGWRGEGVSAEQYGYFSIFGGIYIE